MLEKHRCKTKIKVWKANCPFILWLPSRCIVFQEWQELQQEASKPLQITDRKEQNNKVKQDVQLPLYSSSTVVSLSCWRYWNEGVRRCHPAECFYSESPSHACHSCFKGHVVSCAFRAALFRSHSVDHPIPDFFISPLQTQELEHNHRHRPASVRRIEINQLCVFHHSWHKM